MGAALASSMASGRVEHAERTDLGAELAEPALGRLDDAIGVLVGRRGGHHEHLVGAAQLEELAIEVAAGAPLGAADQGEGPGHGGTLPGAVLAPGCYPSVASRPMADQHAGNRRVGDHGVGHRRGGGQGGGRRDPALAAAGQRRRDGGGAREVARQAGGARQARRDRGQGDRRRGSPPPTTSTALHDCDLVLESVVEDLAVKKELFTRLDDIVKPEGILATNTSTLPVVELAVATERPSQVVGIHFFNPAPMMSLVEVVRPMTASDETRRRRQGLRHRLRQGRGGGEGPRRLHRERAALPVPEQRRADARGRHRQP